MAPKRSFSYQQPVNVFAARKKNRHSIFFMYKNACGDTCMERYLLLRSNRESGPFTLKELKEKGILTTDLFWLDGESTCWKAPADIPELKELAKEPESKVVPMRKAYPASMESTETTAAPISFANQSSGNTSFSSPKSTWQTNDFYDPVLEDQSDIQWQRPRRKKAWQQGLNIGANLFGLATLVIAVMLSAVMVKKAVDNMATEPEEPTADAKEIVSENLREDASQHAALAVPVNAQNSKTVQAVTDSVKSPVADLPKVSAAATVVKKEAQKKKATTNPLPATTAPSSVGEDQAPKEEPEVKSPPDETEKPAAKPTLQVAANEYKVGLFGGVSNLALTVSNPSSVAAQNITLEVEYLKPNGKVVGTKTVEAGSIAPGASKTVTVPDNGRGVSIRYRVLDN